VFCDRKGEAIIAEQSLRMKKSDEPDADVYTRKIGDPKKYDEIVYCGYGEPTIRWEVVKEISRYVKNNGGKTRLNTNGHGNYINQRDITPELKDVIDVVSVSLNTSDIKKYAEIMRVDKKLFDEMIDFTRKSKKYAKEVVMSIVEYPDVDIEAARKFAEEEVGVEFRVRPYF
jgi:TatD DNase family protein